MATMNAAALKKLIDDTVKAPWVVVPARARRSEDPPPAVRPLESKTRFSGAARIPRFRPPPTRVRESPDFVEVLERRVVEMRHTDKGFGTTEPIVWQCKGLVVVETILFYSAGTLYSSSPFPQGSVAAQDASFTLEGFMLTFY